MSEMERKGSKRSFKEPLDPLNIDIMNPHPHKMTNFPPVSHFMKNIYDKRRDKWAGLDSRFSLNFPYKI